MRFLLMLVLMCLATPSTASAGTLVKYNSLHSAVRESGEVLPEIQAATETDANELLCLALNIYHEARGEQERAQWAVGFVTINRAKRAEWGGNICSVVWARSQFSWTVRGVRTLVPREINAWRESQRKAVMLFSNQKADDPTQGATHFYQSRLRPSWSRRLVDKMRIGAHMFARLPLAVVSSK